MDYRVLMVAPTPFFSDRGCHVRILEEIKALQKKGVDIALVTYHIGRDIPGLKIYRTINIPWYRKLEAGPSIHKPYIDLLMVLKVLSVCRRYKPDIIHAHLHEGGWIGSFCSRWYNIPMVLDVQGSMTDELIAHRFLGANRVFMSFFRTLEKSILKKPAALLVSSENTVRLLIEEFHVPEEKVFFAPDGVDTEFIRPVEDKMGLRGKLGLPETKRIVIYVGVLSEYQGIDLLIDAVAMRKKEFSDTLFFMIGYPDERYRKMATEKGVEDIFRFVGRVAYRKIPEYIEASDIGIAPKISETEANSKVLNYMSAALPVVVFDTPVNRFMLAEDGIYARFGDPNDLSLKLLDIINNPEKCAFLGGRLRERVVERFSWDVISDKIVRVYSVLVEG